MRWSARKASKLPRIDPTLESAGPDDDDVDERQAASRRAFERIRMVAAPNEAIGKMGNVPNEANAPNEPKDSRRTNPISPPVADQSPGSLHSVFNSAPLQSVANDGPDLRTAPVASSEPVVCKVVASGLLRDPEPPRFCPAPRLFIV
jgi:hypothetical protein